MRVAILVLTLALFGCEAPQAPAPVTTETPEPVEPPPTIEWQIRSIDWDDADSGDIDGVRFRLYRIDAPETGGVGAAVGAAKCEAERTLGAAAREWIVGLTRDPSTLRVTGIYGADRMEEPRLLIELSANGVDVGRAGIEAGHLRPWPHEGSRQLEPKPDWCP